MIPTYNQAEYIVEAVNSALAQSYPLLEVIVGDDASDDGTQQLLADISDPRFRYVRHQANIGRTENYRRLLFSEATGDFVVNLDGDDYFSNSDFIKEAVDCIQQNAGTVLVVARVTTQNGEMEYTPELPDERLVSGMELIRHLPYGGYSIMHLGAIYNRKLAMELDFYRSKAISSDWESLYRLALRGQVAYLDIIAGVWRVHEGNQTGTRDVYKLLENLDIWPVIYQDARIQGLGRIRAKYYAARCIAFFGGSALPRVSKSGNWTLFKYSLAIARKSLLAGLLMLKKPILGTLVRSFCGQYR